MKKTVKFLVVFCVLALFAVSFATVAYAIDGEEGGGEPEITYTGTVADAQKLLDVVGTKTLLTEKMIAMDKVKVYLRTSPIDPVSTGYEDFKKAYDDAAKGISTEVEKIKTDREDKVSLIEYSYTDGYIMYDFDDGKVPGIGNANTNTYGIKEGYGANGSSSYYEITYKANGSTTADTYLSIKPTGATRGYVIEFDVTTFSELPPSVKFGAGEYGINTGARIYPQYFLIKGTSLCSGNTDGGKELVANAITPGEWTHVSLVYDNTAKTMTLYYNYVEIATYTIALSDDYVMSEFRLGSRNSAGSVAFDNICMYPGSSIRDTKKFEGMEDDEKFITFSDYFGKTENAAVSRKYAFDTAKSMLKNYYDLDKNEYLTQDVKIRAAVDKVLAFDPSEIVDQIRAINLEELKVLFADLEKVQRSLATIGARQTKLSAIELFKKNNDLDETSAEYAEINDKIKLINDIVTKDVNAQKFIYNLDKFDTATTMKAMKKYFNAATELYPNLDVENIPELTDAIERYAGCTAAMEQAVRVNNAEKFIKCVNYIKGYTTEEEFEENFDYINKYILIARGIIYENDYDGTIDEFQDAFKEYVRVNEYFYEALQQEHILVISAKLLAYLTADSFIEQQGACSYIDKYVASNDVDLENAEIKELLNMCDVFKNELDEKKEAYIDVLTQNSVFFVNTVEKMAAANSYTELRELYEEALSYYFFMNSDTEAVINAIDSFIAYQQMIQLTEEKSALFVELVAEIENANTKKDLYIALSSAYAALLDANEECDGMEEAIEIYNAAYAKYNSSIEKINSDLSQTADVVCSVRTNTVAPVLVAVFKKIFD